MRVKRFFPLLAVILLLCSCSRAGDGCSFIFADGMDSAQGTYAFKADLSDTTVIYSTFIAARLNPTGVSEDYVPLEITVVSPRGDVSAERFDFPLKDCGGLVKVSNSKGSSLDVEWPYRSNLKMGGRGTAPGLWKVSIKPLPEAGDAVLGLGFRYSFSNGKR